jgi:hypothetical protein
MVVKILSKMELLINRNHQMNFLQKQTTLALDPRSILAICPLLSPILRGIPMLMLALPRQSHHLPLGCR